MNNERAERNEDIVHMIQHQFDYETSHRDAADNYSVLLDSRELEYRCHKLQFSNAPVEHQLHYYCVVDIAYLGQSELEIVIDEDMLRGIEFNEEDSSYIEACIDATVNVGSYGVYAYMNYPDISIHAVIDLELDRSTTEELEFNQELFQELLHEVSIRPQWCIEELVSGKKKVKK